MGSNVSDLRQSLPLFPIEFYLYLCLILIWGRYKQALAGLLMAGCPSDDDLLDLNGLGTDTRSQGSKDYLSI